MNVTSLPFPLPVGIRCAASQSAAASHVMMQDPSRRTTSLLKVVLHVVLGKFSSVQVFAIFFSTPNQTGVPFGGSFDSEVWINLKKTQTGLRVQFGVCVMPQLVLLCDVRLESGS